MAPAADPPAWLLFAADVACIVNITLLVMYLTNRLECNKYVKMVLTMQALVLVLALVAFRFNA